MTRLEPTPGLEIRPAATGSVAFVLRMNPPSVLLLDEHAWFIFELARGRTANEAELAYMRELDVASAEAFRAGLQLLVDERILEVASNEVSSATQSVDQS
jgi:hypothetical protein